MLQEEEAIRKEDDSGIQKIKTPALSFPLTSLIVCAGISVFLMNFGFLSFFYLVPLGYAVLVYKLVWPVFFAAAIFNAIFSIITHLLTNSTGSLWMELSYFTTIFLCFTWIMGGSKFENLRTAYRFIAASIVGSLAFFTFIAGSRLDTTFNILLRQMAEMLSSVIVSSTEGDAVRRSFLEQFMTPEKVLEVIKAVILRGGALASMFLLFFINRRITLTILQLLKKREKDRGLAAFFAPSYTIWVLSGSLAFILMTGIVKAEIPQIIAWNIFVICIILFLAQGAGIVMHFLERRPHSFRIFFNVLVILLIISPLSTLVAAALLLLGIVENWVAFRTKQV